MSASQAVLAARTGDREWPLASLARGLAVALTSVTVAVTIAAFALTLLDHRAASSLTTPGIAAFAVVGLIIVIKRTRNPIGWIVLTSGFSLAMMALSIAYARRALEVAPGSLPAGDFAAWASSWFPLVTNGLLIGVLPQLYPDGRLVSSRWRMTLVAAFGFIVLGAIGNAFVRQNVEGLDGVTNPYAIRSLNPLFVACIGLSVPAGVIAVLGSTASVVARWRRSLGDERQQIKWFVAGVVPAAAGAVVLHELNTPLADAFLAVGLPLIPLSIGFAILRYRLYELDLFVNRAIVYGVLSGLVLAVYLAVATVAERLAGGERSLAVQATATLIAACSLQPMRSYAQRLVDRLFYGERARPYEVLTLLGARLEHSPQPETVLQTIADTVARALRLPGTAIEVREDQQWITAARYGQVGAQAATFPMVYQGEVIGRLIAERRAPGEEFATTDLRLLADLARQAGVATHAVRVNADLQRSRASLVTAREEERRRLRRDLHDGLGPTLAGAGLSLHAARASLDRDPARVDPLLAALETQIAEAVQDIRRLVYGLRPPALDEVGLVGALRQQAARLERGSALTVRVEAIPPEVGQLPAAVEVAAYRIAAEAMANTARHAHATACKVELRVDGALHLQVSDDGLGIGEEAPAGVGLSSMRERATELGGRLEVTSSPAGTHVRAVLPL